MAKNISRMARGINAKPRFSKVCLIRRVPGARGSGLLPLLKEEQGSLLPTRGTSNKMALRLNQTQIPLRIRVLNRWFHTDYKNWKNTQSI